MTEKIIHSVIEYLEFIKDYTDDNSSKIYFRGENKIYTDRIPGIYRTNSDNTSFKFPNLVSEGPHEYYYDLFSEFGWSVNSKKLFEQIVDAQHFGAVTSILDITSNPLAALFFAASGNYEYNGKVYIYSAQPESIKRYFGHTISLMTYLNFVPNKYINEFILVFNTLLDYISPDSSLGKAIFNREITLSELLKELKNSFNSFSELDVSSYEGLKEFYKNPFIKQKFIVRGKTHEQSTKMALENIVKFIKEISPDSEAELQRIGIFNFSTEDLDAYHDYLLKKISEIITGFLNKLNDVSNIADKYIYPYAIFEDMQKSYIVYPSRLNERIKNQRGAFIIPGYFSTEKIDVNEIQTSIKNSLTNSIKENNRIQVDANSKKQILEQLRQLGIDEGFIYPDIEHIAKTISEKYEN